MKCVDTIVKIYPLRELFNIIYLLFSIGISPHIHGSINVQFFHTQALQKYPHLRNSPLYIIHNQ
jgi:hypothetical protein